MDAQPESTAETAKTAATVFLNISIVIREAQRVRDDTFLLRAMLALPAWYGNAGVHERGDSTSAIALVAEDKSQFIELIRCSINEIS
ncbi:hypothetical protein [Caballeronia sp. ATUFL_M2_KS44]|uniref:hypothetical protein n=1 Tax=Caballeronia sp. ATUFL_M2_KS44 TaxID=2921767 RepID=UPI002028F3FA|nr:hypothetical protein [Caballeronia sp. ATUFL_M2_KS44]